MIGNTLRLGRLFGIELKLDYSWFITFEQCLANSPASETYAPFCAGHNRLNGAPFQTISLV